MKSVVFKPIRVSFTKVVGDVKSFESMDFSTMRQAEQWVENIKKTITITDIQYQINLGF